MTPITVRYANLQDLPQLLLFERAIIAAERPFDTTLKVEETSYYDLPGLLAAENVTLVVAEIAGEIVGCGYARIKEAEGYNKHSHYVYLGFMFVTPERRGQGINGIILAQLKEWARSKGVTELRLEVYAENEPAIKAYSKAGFSALMTTMRLCLPDK